MQCECGFKYDGVTDDELPAWFDEVRASLEGSYSTAETPWQQSGKGGTYEDWERGRRPVAACIDRPGAFLDIGCANGYLLECLMAWSEYPIIPYGLDYAPRLIEMARARLPQVRDHFFLGNAWDWMPRRRFDFVRSELDYVPQNYWRACAERLLERTVDEGGRLLLVEYSSKRMAHEGAWIDEIVREWGFDVVGVRSGIADTGREVARIAIVAR